MGYRKSADNITKKGKTVGKNYGDDGAKVILSGPKPNKSNLNKNMKIGRAHV